MHSFGKLIVVWLVLTFEGKHNSVDACSPVAVVVGAGILGTFLISNNGGPDKSEYASHSLTMFYDRLSTASAKKVRESTSEASVSAKREGRGLSLSERKNLLVEFELTPRITESDLL